MWTIFHNVDSNLMNFWQLIILGQNVNVCLTNTSRSSFQLLALG